MATDIDRYPGLGTRVRISGPEEALDLVRSRYPGAYMEGSTGAERSWLVKGPPSGILVAHHWNPRRGGTHGDLWWIRIADDLDAAIRHDPELR